MPVTPGAPPDPMRACTCPLCSAYRDRVSVPEPEAGGMYASRDDDPAHACQCGMCRDHRSGLDIPPVYRQAGRFSSRTFDQYGYDRDGIDRYGQTHRDRFGYDADGYDADGFNREGYDADGYNADGFNADGFNADGYDENGFNADGYDEDGFNADGYDEDGFNADGVDENDADRNGYYYCADCECRPCACHDDDECCCDSPQLNFAIRNDGCDPLVNDTRVTVSLPAGTISDEGLEAVKYYLRRQALQTDHSGLRSLAYDLETLGNQWQTKNGNYAKRLSRHAYKSYQIKLSQEVMSQVGCIARDHSTAVSSEIDVTRDLNRSAAEFYHEDSCWWGSYSSSRCTLKTNGGFGLRSFSGGCYPSGRAWVMPLRQIQNGNHLELVPTFDTVTPDAYVVFNGYGDLQGYTGARIIAHMSGWTYRKIGFSCEPMYVNAGGYLIAPEEIAQGYTDGELSLDVNQHSNLFYNERQEKKLVHA